MGICVSNCFFLSPGWSALFGSDGFFYDVKTETD